jgi:hypothetical protein
VGLRRASAPLSLVAVLVLAACGGDGGGPGNGSDSGSDKATFVDAAKEHCPDFEKLANLGDQFSPTSGEATDLQAATRATREYSALGKQMADELEQLSPPAGTEAEWTRFVDALRASAQSQGEVIEAASTGDTQRVQELGSEIEGNSIEFAAAQKSLQDAGIAPDCLAAIG